MYRPILSSSKRNLSKLLFTTSNYNAARSNLISIRYMATSTPLGVDTSIENNLKTETNKLSKTLSKFWEKVEIINENDPKNGKHKLTITLDSKPIKTLLGNKLQVDTDREYLALMLLNEWSTLPSLKIKSHSLPLTSIVSRCIDLENALNDLDLLNSDPELAAKIGCKDRSTISNLLLRYLDTDTLLCFSPKKDLDGALRTEQDELYLPIIKKIEQFLTPYGPEKASGEKEKVHLEILDAEVHGLRGNQQNELTKKAATNFMNQLSLWDLVVFEKTVLTTKSFICGILLLKSNEFGVDMETIAKLSTLETIHQTARWGEVEDTHDVAKRDIRRNINAAAIVAYKEPNV
ncbi:related to Protein ATP12, mitochondrial [Saccharomycodes ludwigii]|uniref:Related to Protein ATP12, mitochondrial n=1 Tax=Saccharomycodes ludwigii TaxID=36035 RepID=A0A376BAG0_9ASCO|nr:related to Protein ATP12, mitochondrial [Saccharomycodes ludwigii]